MRFMVNPLLNYWSTPQEAKGVICFPRYGSCLSVYREAFTSDESSPKSSLTDFGPSP